LRLIWRSGQALIANLCSPCQGCKLRLTCKPRLDIFGWNAVDIRGQASPFEQANDICREVELPPAHAMEGRAREGVMVVVPALAERQQPYQPLILTLIVGLEHAPPKGVAHR